MELWQSGTVGERTATLSEAPEPPGTYAGGYTLLADRSTLSREGVGTLRFKILDDDGGTVRGFDMRHASRMHLVVVRRRDLSHYRHLYPAMSLDGTWSVPVELTEVGIYGAVADFSIGGVRRTLLTGLLAEGSAEATPIPEPTTTASVDGYEVRMEGPPPVAGVANRLGFHILYGGQRIAEPDRHFIVPGHLVALRASDLALFHGRPFDTADAGLPALNFALELPDAGLYRLFLQFTYGGRERVVGFTVEVPG